MDEFRGAGNRDKIRTGAKVERWPGSRPTDRGEVTKPLPGRQVPVSWERTADTLIRDVEDVIDIGVDDWLAEVRALIAGRTAVTGVGGGGMTKGAEEA